MVQRLLPYVEDRTLDLVIGRLQEREHDYLRHITQKITRENLALLPFAPNSGNIVPLSFGTYELISLSMPEGRKIPIVEMETHGKIWDDLLIGDSDGNPSGILFTCKTDFSENENVKRFLEWIDYRKPNSLNAFRVSGIYSLLRKQAELDENRRKASLN